MNLLWHFVNYFVHFELWSHTLIAITAVRIADGAAGGSCAPSSPGGVALLQRERRGAGASKFIRRANERGVTSIRHRIAAGRAAVDIVDEAGLARIADLPIVSGDVALVFADRALAGAGARVTQSR